MLKSRYVVVLVGILSVSACGSTPFKESSAARFDTHPLAFHTGPKLTGEVSHTTITNEAELTSAAERIKAETFEPVDGEAEASTSARSNISLL